MKLRNLLFVMVLVLALVVAAVSVALADGGEMLRRNLSKTPDGETGHAGMSVMGLNVPAQNSKGELIGIVYSDANEVEIGTRDYAMPLVAVYVDDVGATETVRLNAQSGASFGARDAFVAHSLDDGRSWKRSNVSMSADDSSFTLTDGHTYPGDVVAMTHAVTGTRVFAAWISKYCGGGTPGYIIVQNEDEAYIAADNEMIVIDPAADSWDTTDIPLRDFYLEDAFGVAGSQKSVDYTAQGHPEVGEVPYGCVWTARGILEEGTNDLGETIYDVTWRKPERLTSGVRDPNKIEVAGVEGAGFVAVWQEDPDGLRPGSGEGPGAGWAGAIVNAKTDIWYSYISWDDFEYVDFETDQAEFLEGTPASVGVRMSVPVRATDNNVCQVMGGEDVTKEAPPYCLPDVSETGDVPDFDNNGTADFCADSIDMEGKNNPVCVTEDGRVLAGRVGASRPRIGLHGYVNSAGDTSAWVILGYEETKGLGDQGDDTLDSIDEGKNVWYESFDMFEPARVGHGNMLNQPAKIPDNDFDPSNDAFYELVNTVAIEGVDLGAYNYNFYDTEIARRFSLISQEATAAEDADTTAFILYKQGILNQGGPADILARRIVLPDDFNSTVDNPYAFENMACEEWDFNDGTHPYYPDGVCLDNPINLSSPTCETWTGGTSADCPAHADWVAAVTDPETTPEAGKMAYWQFISDGSGEGEWDNLDDQIWENPFDVAKGHRGFMDGDYVMVMYAWAPNWKLNAIGHDHYNLYARRSFDGGQTWTTTPAGDLGGLGTTLCENYYTDPGGGVETDGGMYKVCETLGAGVFEPGRNLSQLTGQKETILDPRYAPTMDSVWTDGGPLYPDDERDHSKFFIVYETGDNTTVETGEATPLDLFYSRASRYGDVYEYEALDDADLSDEERDVATCADGMCVVPGFDWLEHDGDDLSGEAGIRSNPGGNFFYAAWNQWNEDENEVISNSDAWFRRVQYDVGNFVGGLGVVIVSVSHDEVSWVSGETVIFNGAAWAAGKHSPGQGITQYKWKSDLQGLLSDKEDFEMAAVDFQLGTHTITFTAKDEDGNWAPERKTTLVVTEFAPAPGGQHQIYMPMITR